MAAGACRKGAYFGSDIKTSRLSLKPPVPAVWLSIWKRRGRSLSPRCLRWITGDGDGPLAGGRCQTRITAFDSWRTPCQRPVVSTGLIAGKPAPTEM